MDPSVLVYQPLKCLLGLLVVSRVVLTELLLESEKVVFVVLEFEGFHGVSVKLFDEFLLGSLSLGLTVFSGL